MLSNDIPIDAIYSNIKTVLENSSQPETKKEQIKRPEPKRPKELWEDYKQIYIDFNLNSDQKVKERVLFVNSFDGDFNPRIEEVQLDRKGFFLFDT